MIKLGLASKIWIAMFALVVLVLGISAIFQSGMIEKIYISQQSDHILEIGQDFAGEIEMRGDRLDIDRNVSALAGALNASVLVIDSRAMIISWSANRGMGGMGRRGMMGGGAHGMAFPFDEWDVKEVLGGKTVVRKGNSQLWGFDVIGVAIPVFSENKVAGAVMIHSPLAPIQANLRVIHEAVLYSFLFGIVAATLLAFVFSRKVSGPILKINNVARAMARGDYSQKIPTMSGDELGVLAGSINELSEQIKEKILTIEKIDSTRRGFVASISHELRTPLTIMQGYTEALMDGMARDDLQREKYLMNIYEETIRLRRLVDDLLDLRRLETGTISINMDRADLSDIIQSVSDLFSETFSQRGVSISLNIPQARLIARGDPDRLKQVVINMVDNAVRFSPNGGTVDVKGEEVSGHIRVSVRDQGPGVREEEMQLIWERFYKSDNSRTRRNSGSGLGLAIARQIIEMHGGQVGIESLPGHGSTFWFTVKAESKQLCRNFI
ncbi:MAG: hypothetical protein VR68_10500 [Peptococcaceae bacterium BRH_c4a]|nr:MAG: hypothetical protein VR68_10500 [Peptococcaceae bacterium BRH_c4a]